MQLSFMEEDRRMLFGVIKEENQKGMYSLGESYRKKGVSLINNLLLKLKQNNIIYLSKVERKVVYGACMILLHRHQQQEIRIKDLMSRMRLYDNIR